MKITNKVTPAYIGGLKDNEIFVFGSNKSGIHGAGAARLAKDKFGAIPGLGEGPMGDCYAIPTVDYNIKGSLSLEVIKKHVIKFINRAKEETDFQFLVTEIGCGLAGHRVEDIAPLFKEAINVDNISLPQRFIEVLENGI